MDRDFSSNARRFQDGHWLNYNWIGDPMASANLFYLFSVRDVLEDLILLMKSMTYFVDRLQFRDC